MLEDFDHSVADLLNVQRINIYELELLAFDSSVSSEAEAPLPDGDNKGPDGRINVADTSGLDLAVATVRIACSKGTYIRALARDFGEALDSGAHLSSLRRTKSGGFDVETALSVQQALSLLPVNTRV